MPESENLRSLSGGAPTQPRDEPYKALASMMQDDPWVHRSVHMRCSTCMFFVRKQKQFRDTPQVAMDLGRCRRHAPTMSGYPAVFTSDWCGDHKIDENKI